MTLACQTICIKPYAHRSNSYVVKINVELAMEWNDGVEYGMEYEKESPTKMQQQTTYCSKRD